MNFANAILKMNKMYTLPVSIVPGFTALQTDPLTQLKNFRSILGKECKELDDILPMVVPGSDISVSDDRDLDALTALADLLGDIVVFCRSEAMKFGIPLEEVLDIIMESNFSKLGADGLPIIDSEGKFLKGPNYFKPEPQIKKLLATRMLSLEETKKLAHQLEQEAEAVFRTAQVARAELLDKSQMLQRHIGALLNAGE